MKRLISIACLSLFCLGLAACNTVAGVGKDMQKAGEKVEEKADEKSGG